MIGVKKLLLRASARAGFSGRSGNQALDRRLYPTFNSDNIIQLVVPIDAVGTVQSTG